MNIMANEIALETAKTFWHKLQKPITGGMDEVVALAEEAEAAGLNREDMKFLSRLTNEPNEQDISILNADRASR